MPMHHPYSHSDQMSITFLRPFAVVVVVFLCSFFSAAYPFRDDALLQAWHELLALQANQSAVANRDHPVDERLLTALRKCGRAGAVASFLPGGHDITPPDDGTDNGKNGNNGNGKNGDNGNGKNGNENTVVRMRSAASAASTLAPQWVEIYAEVGHLTHFCGTNVEHWMEKRRTATTGIDIRELAEEFRNNCSSASLPSSSSPSIHQSNAFMLSLAQMFGTMGAHIVPVSADGAGVGAATAAAVAEGDRCKNLQQCTRRMVANVRRIVRAHSARWKLVLIAPGLYDIPYGQSSAVLAQDVLQSIQLIRHSLPRRTFLLVLRQSNLTFWRSVAKTAAFCSKMLSLWDLGRAEEDERAWDLLEARLRTVYGDDEQFHVQMVDLMERARPVITAGNYADLSPLAADCVHLSPRGLSLLHVQLWNWLVQPRVRHTQPFVPLLRPPLCPRPHCPFLATSRNIISCPRLPLRRAKNSVQLSLAGRVLLLFLPFALLIAAVVAFLTAFANICPRRQKGFTPV